MTVLRKIKTACCLALLSAGFAARAEILIEENFPGYAEFPDWRYDWIRGAGSVTFHPENNGYARYQLTGPAGGDEYHNAELYRPLSNSPVYCDFEIRCRSSNNVGYDAPSWPPDPDPLYGMGSRGWGLWNRVTDPQSQPANYIWFICYSPESDPSLRGRRIFIMRDSIPVVSQEMNIDLTQRHTFRIKWRADYLGVFIDDMNNPVVELTDPVLIPHDQMTYTTWIDNGVVEIDQNGDFQVGRLPVPDFIQYVDVDYIRVYMITCPADLDENGEVDQADLGILLASYGMNAGGDLDGDGDTDQADLGQLLADYGTDCS